jgi:hypothetical protein
MQYSIMAVAINTIVEDARFSACSLNLIIKSIVMNKIHHNVYGSEQGIFIIIILRNLKHVNDSGQLVTLTVPPDYQYVAR